MVQACRDHVVPVVLRHGPGSPGSAIAAAANAFFVRISFLMRYWRTIRRRGSCQESCREGRTGTLLAAMRAAAACSCCRRRVTARDGEATRPDGTPRSVRGAALRTCNTFHRLCITDRRETTGYLLNRFSRILEQFRSVWTSWLTCPVLEAHGLYSRLQYR